MPSPEARRLRATFTRAAPDARWSVDQARRDWEAAVASENARLDNRCTVDVLPLRGVPAERVALPEHRGDAVVMLLHGGGFNAGSPRTHRALAVRLGVATGMPVVVPDYRRAPEHPCPAAVDDAVAAWHGIRDLGYQPERIVLVGDSAGATLVLAALLALRDAGDALPAGAALLSPWVDLTLSGPSIDTHATIDPFSTLAGLQRAADLYVAGGDPARPVASPLFGDLHGLPPLLVHAGGLELLLSDALRLAERAAMAGVAVQLRVWEGLWHVFQMADIPEARAALAEVGSFCREVLT